MAVVHPSRGSATSGDSAQLYRLIADTIPHMVWTARADGALDYVNARVLEYTGLPENAHLGWDWKVVIHPEDWGRCLETWTRSLETGERYEIEYRLRRADGVYRWHYGAALPLHVDGHISHWFGTCTDIEERVRSDITDRKRAEQALLESEARFRAFMAHMPAAAFIKDGGLRYSYVNRTYESVYGRAARDVLGRDDYDLHPPERARVFREEDERIRRTGEALQRMHELPYADGRLGHWVLTKFPLEGGVAGIAIDVTPRLEAEEKARHYANRLVQAQEAERRRIADGLHDLIGQNLTALGIDLQALKQRLHSRGDPASGPKLDAMAALVETTIDAIRGVMTDLKPPALEEFGLVPALRWYASQFAARTGMKVATHAEGRERRLPPDTELALFRIAQEALTNAAKHSGGKNVQIGLRYGESGLRLTVTDDGRGFAEREGARGERGGFGLQTMRERAEAAGGTLGMEFPERGCRIVVEIP